MAEASLTPGSGRRGGGDRHQVVLHLDGAGHRELEDGSAVSAQTARRMLCDASLVPLVESSDGEPISVGRRTRTIPGAVRRALHFRDGGCRFPGCTHERFVDAHHIEHWADGGATAVDNLVLLCRRHHRLIHEGGFSVARTGGGPIEFRDRFGALLTAAPPSLPEGRADALVGGGDVGPPPLPSGDPLDLGLTVDCMIERRERARAA